MNPGGVRADLDPNRDGVVTFEESFSMQPYGNEYATVDLTPAQVYTLLEQQWADESTRTWIPLQQLGLSKSITYTYAVDAPFGEHIKKVFIDGVELDRNASTVLTVASNAYLATGGDGYNVLKEGQNFQTNGMIDVDVFNEYLARNPGLVVDYSQRNISISGEDALVAGQSATIELGSLSMTWATEQQPLPTTVELFYGDEKLGEASIDNTIDPTLNETGTASVSFTVPEGLEPGVHQFTIVAGPTTMQVPVTVVASGGFEVTPAPGTVGNVLFASDWTNPVATHANTVDPAEHVYVGDWANLGADTFLLRNGNEYTVHYSNRVDSPTSQLTIGEVDDDFVVGDFNGDNYFDLALRTAGTNEIRVYTDDLSTGPTTTFHFGRPGDELVVGDWDGDGTDTIGVKRGNAFYLRNDLSSGNADQNFTFGRAEDKVLAGDFDGDGVDTISVARGNSVFLKNALEGGAADSVFTFGRATDIRVVGDFFGTGIDTLAVVRW